MHAAGGIKQQSHRKRGVLFREMSDGLLDGLTRRSIVNLGEGGPRIVYRLGRERERTEQWQAGKNCETC
jgi:hypothetical protein